jgi:NADPH:quinone reductase-like Zn-dependent oxidoreductase
MTALYLQSNVLRTAAHKETPCVRWSCPVWGEVSALREVADPEARPGEAVMKVRSAGVGLTLLNMRSCRFGGSTPRIMGHELSGDIVAVGDGVTNVKTAVPCIFTSPAGTAADAEVVGKPFARNSGATLGFIATAVLPI